jgi:hypothetical protein
MKKLIVLLSGVVIAASAAAQTNQAGTNAAQPAKAGTADRQAPVKSDSAKRVNPAAEPEDSANSVSTDFQGSSKQESTAAGMGQPVKPAERTTKSSTSGANTQDVEDKTKK